MEKYNMQPSPEFMQSEALEPAQGPKIAMSRDIEPATE